MVLGGKERKNNKTGKSFVQIGIWVLCLIVMWWSLWLIPKVIISEAQFLNAVGLFEDEKPSLTVTLIYKIGQFLSPYYHFIFAFYTIIWILVASLLISKWRRKYPPDIKSFLIASLVVLIISTSLGGYIIYLSRSSIVTFIK